MFRLLDCHYIEIPLIRSLAKIRLWVCDRAILKVISLIQSSDFWITHRYFPPTRDFRNRFSKSHGWQNFLTQNIDPTNFRGLPHTCRKDWLGRILASCGEKILKQRNYPQEVGWLTKYGSYKFEVYYLWWGQRLLVDAEKGGFYEKAIFIMDLWFHASEELHIKREINLVFVGVGVITFFIAETFFFLWNLNRKVSSLLLWKLR